MHSAIHTLLVTLMIGLLSGCSGQQAPITIGFTGTLSGRLVDLGYSGRSGAQLAIEQQNRAGGINGRQLKLTTFDNRLDAKQMHKIVEQFASSGGEVMIGPFTSAMAVAATEAANKHHLLLISPTATTTDLKGRDDQFLRVITGTTGHATEMATHLYTVEQLRTVSVILDEGNASYTESWLTGFRSAYEKLGGPSSSRFDLPVAQRCYICRWPKRYYNHSQMPS